MEKEFKINKIAMTIYHVLIEIVLLFAVLILSKNFKLEKEFLITFIIVILSTLLFFLESLVVFTETIKFSYDYVSISTVFYTKKLMIQDFTKKYMISSLMPVHSFCFQFGKENILIFISRNDSTKLENELRNRIRDHDGFH